MIYESIWNVELNLIFFEFYGKKKVKPCFRRTQQMLQMILEINKLSYDEIENRNGGHREGLAN